MITDFDDIPDLVRNLESQIAQSMERLADELRSGGPKSDPRFVEADVFREFDRLVPRVWYRYRSLLAQTRNHTGLLFEGFYDRVEPSGKERLVQILSTLMAALVESQGPTRLTRYQAERLADVLRTLGDELLGEMSLPEHATAAFQRAAQLYGEVGDFGELKQCRRRLARARRRAKARPWRPSISRSRIPRPPIPWRVAQSATALQLISILVVTGITVGLLTYLVENRVSHARSTMGTWFPVAMALLATGLAALATLRRRGTVQVSEWLLVAAMVSLSAACYVTSNNATRSVLAAAEPAHVIEPTSAAQVVTAVGGLVTAVGLSISAVIKAVALLIQARADLTKARKGIESGDKGSPGAES